MDPQQRLLLEVAWEALEDAGHGAGALARPRRASSSASATQRLRAPAACGGRSSRIDAYDGTGNAVSFAAGRLSYCSGCTGPASSVDTACSSSLVAVHLACQSLRAGECDARAGRRRQPDPDAPTRDHPVAQGRHARPRRAVQDLRRRRRRLRRAARAAASWCSSALADALADGDRILAVIRGSAVNQDGRTSGLTAPNGPAQEAVIRARAGRAPASRRATIGYVEAHGTGTAARRPDRGAGARPRCSARAAVRTGRCCSARSRPTSATSRRPPASPG